MKRVIILFGALVFCMALPAQNYKLCGMTLVRGGYNCFSEQPVVDLSVVAGINNLCSKIEIGCTQIRLSEYGEKLSHIYFSPSIGIMAGDLYHVYAMVGIIPWAGYVKRNDSRMLTDDIWFPKFEAGVSVPIRDIFCFNFEVLYMWPDSSTDRQLQNLTLRMGFAVTL